MLLLLLLVSGVVSTISLAIFSVAPLMIGLMFSTSSYLVTGVIVVVIHKHELLRPLALPHFHKGIAIRRTTNRTDLFSSRAVKDGYRGSDGKFKSIIILIMVGKPPISAIGTGIVTI